MDADAAVARGEQAQEPVTVSLDAATSILEVVPPGAGVLDGGDFEGFALGRLGSLHVAATLLVALVLAQAAREVSQQLLVAVIDAQVEVFLRDNNECPVGLGLGGSVCGIEHHGLVGLDQRSTLALVDRFGLLLWCGHWRVRACRALSCQRCGPVFFAIGHLLFLFCSLFGRFGHSILAHGRQAHAQHTCHCNGKYLLHHYMIIKVSEVVKELSS